MARQRKPKPQAVILPPELDDDDEEAGSVMPDDDGWITLEGDNGTVKEGSGNPGNRTTGGRGDRVARKTARKRQKRAD